MKKRTKSRIAILCGLVLISMLLAPAVYADQMTIKGEISDWGTIVTESGDEYTITDNDQIDRLMENAGKKVTVVGTVTEDEGEKTITVTSYTIEKEE